MKNVNYFSYKWTSLQSGGGVFDTRLVNALRDRHTVREFPVPASRVWTLPLWKRRVNPPLVPRTGSVNVVSHEGLHELLDHFSVDCFIVHNYFAEFDFPRLKFINPLYRLGSDRIFHKIFCQSARVIFLSSRERRLASAKYPEFASKFLCNPPGHNANSVYFDGVRGPTIIEMPGTIDWAPKHLSYWLNVGGRWPITCTLVRGQVDSAYISVIYDSFLSGFKLKLVEMAKHAKSIVSFCDLEEEMRSLGFEDLPYVFVRNRAELIEGITTFQSRGDLPLKDREAFYRRGSALSWSNLADAVLD